MKSKVILCGVVLVAGALIAASAFAGQKDQAPVYVYTGTGAGEAYGGYGTARAGLDGEQIYCSVTFSSIGGAPSDVYCKATDAAGNSRSCHFPTPIDGGFVLALNAVSDDSWLLFAWDSTGKCSAVQVVNGSQYEPKGL